RAALWVSAVLLSLGVVLSVFDFSSTATQLAAGANSSAAQVEQAFGSGNLALIDGLQVLLLLVKLAVAALTVMAALRWTRLPSSRSFARFAWIAALGLPLVIASFPWGQLLDFSHLDDGFGQAQSAAAQQQVSVAIGATLLITVAPKLLALFPGIVRSSLTLKTLLPQASAPGWLAVVFAPFLAGFLLLVLSFLSQVQGSAALILGVMCLVAGPVIYVRRARDLVRPHTDDEVGVVVSGVRKQARMFHALAGVLLFVYFADLEGLSWLSLTHLLLEAAGGVLLTMVAISDVTLALLAFSHRQGAAFHASDLRAQHERRLAALSSGGLTNVDEAFGLARPDVDFSAQTMPNIAPIRSVDEVRRTGSS
ncbi:MAG: hypothetical protein KAI24_15495, partial [Planctomycetes bacterium]|nr:hypothetical protein [Planctomycetota bacterium]